MAKLHEKEAKVEINQLLDEKPKQIMGCLAALKADMFMPKESLDESDTWPRNFVRFDQVPKWWMVAWMSKSGPTTLSKEVLWKIDATDLKCALRNLVEFFTGLKSTARLPPSCQTKQVLKLTLDKHLQALGRCTAEWVANAIDDDGLIDWNTWGAYSFVGRSEDDVLVEVTDIKNLQGTRSAIGDEVTIKPDCVISKNFSDELAGIYRGILNLNFSAHMRAFALNPDIFGDQAFDRHSVLALYDYDAAQANAASGSIVAMASEAPARGRRRQRSPSPMTLALQDGPVAPSNRRSVVSSA
jgi:hypothetical protein